MTTRRGLRLHLLSHGLSWAETHGIATDVSRSRPPTSWKCKGCRRRFATVRGLSLHSRNAGHGEPVQTAGSSASLESRRRTAPA